MQILDFDSNVFMAPMAGITDKPLRKLVSSLGKGVMVSEMVAINAIQRKNPKTYRIADVRDENYPVVVQLVGNDPELFSEAAKLAEELGAHSLDINMGCPVKKIVNNHAGSALMKDRGLAEKIIEAVVKATPLKVSVKFRKGWDAANINAVDFAKMCEDSGASYITVHGRTRSAFYSGEADWNIIREVKKAVKIPVIGNGDINTPYDAKRMIEETGVDGVMIGTILGLVIGKPIGIFLFAYLGEKCNLSVRPEGLCNFHILAVGAISGVGFTMSIFVANLAYGDDVSAIDLSKISILIASSIAVVLGIILMSLATRTPRQNEEQDSQDL